MCLLVYISYLSGLILVLTTALHAVSREALYSSSFSVFSFHRLLPDNKSREKRFSYSATRETAK